MLRNPPIEFSLDERSALAHSRLAAYFLYISKRMREKSSASSPPAPETIERIADDLSNAPPPASLALRSWYSFSVACALSLSLQKSAAPIAASISAIRFSTSSLVMPFVYRCFVPCFVCIAYALKSFSPNNNPLPFCIKFGFHCLNLFPCFSHSVLYFFSFFLRKNRPLNAHQKLKILAFCPHKFLFINKYMVFKRLLLRKELL